MSKHMATGVRRSTVPIPHDQSGTRRGGLRSKTPSMNELSKKMKNTPKGKRRLEFVEQPLKGKTFYLDLIAYKKVSSLAARIQNLGGKVEEFLSKDINYLITNRKDADTRLSPRSNSTPSPGLSIPSPFPPTGNRSSSMKGAWPSPLSGDSPQSIETHQPAPKHDTRAKTIVKQAQATLTNRYGTSNTLTNARTWGVCVIYLEKALEKLAEYGPSQADKQPTIKDLMGFGKKQLRVKIRKLQVPFIKVEDQSHQFRPLVKEFKEWPFPDFDSPVGTCPFDTTRKRRDHEPKKRNKDKEPQKDNKKGKTKQGYCECCCLHYDALDVHLKSDHHQSFAKNDSNYQNLDQLISQGPSLKVFLEKMKIKYNGSTSQDKHPNGDEISNPFQTPKKDNDVDRLYDKNDHNEGSPSNHANNKDKQHIEYKTSKGKTPTEDSCPSPLPAQPTTPNISNDSETRQVTRSRSPLPAKPTTPNISNDCETRRVTRSHSSPENTKLREIYVVLDVDISKEVPLESRKTVAKTQKWKEPKSDSQHQIKLKTHQTSRVTSSYSFDTTEVPKVDDKATLQNGETQPHIVNDTDDKLDNHKEDDNANNTASVEPRFTRLRSARKSLQNDVDDFKTKRVLRSSSKTCSSDSTETLSNNEGVHPVSLSKRQDTDELSSSTVSLSEKGSKSGPAGSPRKRSAKSSKKNVNTTKHRNNKTSPLEIDCDTNATEAKDHKNSTFQPSVGQMISSPSSGPTVNTAVIKDSDHSSGCEENSSLIAEPGTPKASRKSLKKTRREKKKEETSNQPKEGESSQDSQVESQDTLQAVQEQKKPATVLDETFTSLFDSNDDDDEPFEGFDIPNFDGSKSSEHDYMYRIKEIINYYTSSQESTLVESGADDSPIKRKKQPHGIKMIISSRTDDGDDDVFEDKNSDDDDDDDDDDDRSTIADSTDGNEDEHLISSPLRMDNLYNKRKSWNLDGMDDQQPSKRRRTTAEDSDELQSSSQNTVDDNDHQSSVDSTETEPRATRSRSTRNNKTSDNQDCNREEAESMRRVTRNQELKTTVRLKSNEWKVVSNDNKTASTNPRKNKKTSSSSRNKKHCSVEKPLPEDSRLQSLEPQSQENNDLKNSSIYTESLPEQSESSLLTSMNERVNEIPPEFLEPSIVVTSIEERVKLRRLGNQNQVDRTKVTKRVSGSKSHMKVRDKEASKPTKHVREAKVRSVSVTDVRKSSVSKRSLQNDSTPDINSRLRSRSQNQITITQESSISGNTKVSSTPCQMKSSKGSSPLVNPNKSQNASWIFSPDKFTASTPQTSNKTRSKSSNSTNNHETSTRHKLRNTSRCLIAGDSYEFTDDDAYRFD